MSRPKFVLIDGHSLAYRAFYALPTSMINTKGQVTNAVHGFTNMLLRIIEEQKPAAIAVAFDLPKPTFRHKEFKEYKNLRISIFKDEGGDVVREYKEIGEVDGKTAL